MAENEIVLCKDNYFSEKEFESDLANFIKIMTNNRFQLCIVQEEKGIYSIGYCHDKYAEDWGAERYMLVTAEEEESILQNRELSQDCCKYEKENQEIEEVTENE